MFKTAIVGLLAFFYLISLNAPLVYYAENQINLDYIIKYLCEQKDEEENLCLGNCYLKKNLAKTETPEKKTENGTLQIPNTNVSPHFTYNNNINFYQTEKKTNYLLPASHIKSQIFIKPLPLPPELLSV